MSGSKSKKNKNEYKINSSQDVVHYLKDKPGSNDPKVLVEYIRNKR